jgi:ABC-type transporter Mla subunit MlaD
VNPRPHRGGSIASNPVLIGAATVLVVLVAVFLSYNANNGLPFVPTYELTAEVPNASGLIKGNEVRIGGARVGVVSRIEAFSRPDGSTGARLSLKLEAAQPELPRDSTILVRPRSPLGLKYVEITTGRSRATFPNRATIPLSAAQVEPVELDEFFGMFDEPTRTGQADGLIEWGNAFAGRGDDLNRAFRDLGPLLDHLDPALENLVAPATEFDELFPAFEQAAREVAPVALEQARMFEGLDRTFAAFSSVRESLKDSISGGPPALDVATRELPAQAGFVEDSTTLFRKFRPAFASLAHASPGLASAFRKGEPALRRAPALNTRLVSALESVEAFAADARVEPAVERLARFATLLEPTVAFVTPAQTTCNYLALLFRNVSSAVSESDVVGSFLRFGVIAMKQGTNSEAGPASAPANGPALPYTRDNLPFMDSFLHSNPYPNTAAPGQVRECEAGNERYQAGGQAIGNQPGNQGTFSEQIERAGG